MLRAETDRLVHREANVAMRTVTKRRAKGQPVSPELLQVAAGESWMEDFVSLLTESVT